MYGTKKGINNKNMKIRFKQRWSTILPISTKRTPILSFTIYKSYHLSEQKTNNVNVYKFLYMNSIKELMR